uniref:Uncharacterized protein n=1 Tax=Glossina austeni TaxID=7395 RepID=A0A1A9ULH0_GLOAU
MIEWTGADIMVNGTSLTILAARQLNLSGIVQQRIAIILNECGKKDRNKRKRMERNEKQRKGKERKGKEEEEECKSEIYLSVAVFNYGRNSLCLCMHSKKKALKQPSATSGYQLDQRKEERWIIINRRVTNNTKQNLRNATDSATNRLDHWDQSAF